MSPRWVVASAVSSAVVVGTIGVGLYAIAGRTPSERVPLSGLYNLLFYLFLIGWPLAFVLTLLVAGVALWTLERRRRVIGLAEVAVTAAVFGAISVPVAVGATWHEPWSIAQSVVIGAVAGLLGGLCFWLFTKPRLT